MQKHKRLYLVRSKDGYILWRLVGMPAIFTTHTEARKWIKSKQYKGLEVVKLTIPRRVI